jgi:hypothetical protein
LSFGNGSPVSGATERFAEGGLVVAVVEVDATTVVVVVELASAPTAKKTLDKVARVTAMVIGTRRRIEET